ncbi:MAG: histone deacetylase family protein, partial [Serpentinimonas sp.]|nr:histone deacetylase family protein [Serpentinimonas sp.]
MKPTGYFTHPICRKHDMGAGHPECADRLGAIEDRLLITGLADALERREPGPASQSELELAHSRSYIASLRGMTDELNEEIKAGGPQRLQLDPDTSINPYTYQAALMAAGAALNATDAVL